MILTEKVFLVDRENLEVVSKSKRLKIGRVLFLINNMMIWYREKRIS